MARKGNPGKQERIVASSGTLDQAARELNNPAARRQSAEVEIPQRPIKDQDKRA